MKIKSKNDSSYATIDLKGDKNYSSYSIEVELFTAVLSTFKGINQDIHLLNLENFLEELDAFITNRKIQPRLYGTYDFSLAINAIGSTKVWINIYLGCDATIPEFKTLRYCDRRLSGVTSSR